jgi:hypothetical protein
MEIEILASYANEEDGTASYVFKGERGFHAVGKDVDSGETFAVIIYPTFERANAKAKEILGV